MSFNSKKVAEINLWNDNSLFGIEPPLQQQYGCGVCGLTNQELSTIDPDTGDELQGQRSLALPCEECGGDYEEHESCDRCGGDAEIECEECLGRGSFNCQYCHQGENECPECEGSGVVENEETEEVEDCPDCSGEGKVECYECGGSGEHDCEECYGNGTFECPDCEGYGNQDCKECGGDGIAEFANLEEWCGHWTNAFDWQRGDVDLKPYYPWTGLHRPDIIWTDHCLAYGPESDQPVAPSQIQVVNQPVTDPQQNPTDQQGFNLAKVGSNKSVWAYKRANELWGEENNQNQLRLIGCPECGSDELYARFDTDGDIAPIEVQCEECGEDFAYQDYTNYANKLVTGYPTLVEDTLAQQGSYKDGPEDAESYKLYIEALPSGRDNEFYNEELADGLIDWATMSNTLPELEKAADAITDQTSMEISEWTQEGLVYDSDYIDSPAIEDMSDEEFFDQFGEDKTREEAIAESDDTWNWYYNENARNYGLHQAAQHILEHFRNQA